MTTTAETATVDKTWQKYVRQAQTALKAADKGAWALGKVAHDVTADAQYGDGCIAKLAEEVDLGASTLRQYRQTVEAYETAERSAQNSFSIHVLFAGLDDRVELINSKKWTAREARELLKARKGQSDPAGETQEGAEDAVESNAGGSESSEGTTATPVAPVLSPVERARAWVKEGLAVITFDEWELIVRTFDPGDVQAIVNRLQPALPKPTRKANAAKVADLQRASAPKEPALRTAA